MHIGILNLSGAHWLGGRYYFENMVRALSRLDGFQSEFRVSYVIAAENAEVQEGEIGRLCEVIVAPELVAPAGDLLARGRRYFQRKFFGVQNPAVHRFLIEQGIDFAFPTATGGEAIGGYRTAHWIADLQYKHFPQFQLPETLRNQDVYISGIASTASTVVVSSEFGARDCERFFATPPDRLFVLPFRVVFAEGMLDGDIASTLQRFHIPERFLLVSNQFWQNKNHMVVFDAIGRLKMQGISVNVVFTGHVYDPRLPSYCDDVHARVHELGIRNEVFLLGAIPRSEQVNLMRQAVAILQPSRFEGWNTSIEEARAIGRPVLASDFEVHREQAWKNMTLFAMDDSIALADAIECAWSVGKPGDRETEHASQAKYEEKVTEFGSRFLELARR